MSSSMGNLFGWAFSGKGAGDKATDMVDPFGIARKQTPGQDFMGSQFADLASYGPNPYSSGLQSMIQGLSGSNYKAKDMSTAAMPQYDAMRSRINSQYSETQGKAQDAINRQFAAMGGGPGNGAQLKQTENLAYNTEKQKGQDLEGLGAQEAEARQNLQREENQKEFQSAETGRQLQIGGYGTLAQLNTAWDQASAEAINNEFNKQMSQYQATHSGGLLGGGGFLGLGLSL